MVLQADTLRRLPPLPTRTRRASSAERSDMLLVPDSRSSESARVRPSVPPMQQGVIVSVAETPLQVRAQTVWNCSKKADTGGRTTAGTDQIDSVFIMLCYFQTHSDHLEVWQMVCHLVTVPLPHPLLRPARKIIPI
jgi:hypothetical protein